MALLTLPEGQQRSGSVGGAVFSHNAAGPYIRARSIPVNPNTDRQVAVRNAVRTLSIRWELGLTQVERDAWDVYAANVAWVNRLGHVIHLTGLNHYVRSNTLRAVLALTIIDAAPVIFDIGTAEPALAVTASEAAQTYSLAFDDSLLQDDPWVDVDGAFQFFSLGIPQNASRKFFNGPWRQAGVIPGSVGAPPVSPVISLPAFPFAEGQRLWVRSSISRPDGRLSQFAQVNFLAAA